MKNKTMQRRRPPGDNGNPNRQLGERIARIQALEHVILSGSLSGRLNLAARMGQQYGGDRNIYQALGYPTGDIPYNDYFARYKRQDIAGAIIDRPVRATWSGELLITESSDDKETALEKAWKDLDDQFGVKSRFAQLDKLTGIGHYGILLLGLDDTKNKEDYANPVTSGKRQLRFLMPRSENSAEVKRYDTQSSSRRYGMPVMYNIAITDTATGNTTDINVHYTRVLHVTDDALESDTVGTPRLEGVWNRLMDLEKVVGGSAEMFWRGARPGYLAKIQEGYQLTTEEEDKLQAQIDEYEHKLRRILTGIGLEDLKGLAQQVSDPKGHVDVLIQMISAKTGIPKRILTGSERGELSSTQDKENWLSYIQSRREEYAETRIVRPFVKRCIELGILPGASEEGYNVQWEDLFAQSDKERVEVGKFRAEAIAKYANAPGAESVIPPEAFLKYFLGLSGEDVEWIQELAEQQQRELESEEQVTEEERKLLEEE